jgi:hypothetical protein
MVGRRGLAAPIHIAGTFVPKGLLLHAGLSKNRLLQGSAGTLPSLAPAAVSRRCGPHRPTGSKHGAGRSMEKLGLQVQATWRAGIFYLTAPFDELDGA